MSEQLEIISERPLLNKDGRIEEPGWARHELFTYNREAIHAPWYRRKEWDYYLFTNDKFALAFTISDLGYVGLISASFIDLEHAVDRTNTDLDILPRGKKYGLGASTEEGHAEAHTKNIDLVFEKNGPVRTIACTYRNFFEGKTLVCDLTVDDHPQEAMYIATPWAEKPTAFYYNCKHNLLSAWGTVKLGDEVFEVKKGENYGCLDWGRGVWTYDNTWYWGTGSGVVDGKPFGFNLGYGFSDRSSCSENCLYYEDKVHKLDEVEFLIPMNEVGEYQYLEPWMIESNDGNFKADFLPILDRAAEMKVGPVASSQHQVFGKMTGKAVLEDGREIAFRDYVCTLEVVHNKY